MEPEAGQLGPGDFIQPGQRADTAMGGGSRGAGVGGELLSAALQHSSDTRLRARMGGLGDQAPRNRWEVSRGSNVITCLQPNSLNKRLTV